VNNEIIKFKNRIIEENINTTGTRRKFSPQLKEDIISFVNHYKLSSANAAQLIGIGNTTIEKWRRSHKKQFRKVNVSQTPKESPKKKSKIPHLNPVMLNQIVLIVLLALQIIERLFVHLIS